MIPKQKQYITQMRKVYVNAPSKAELRKMISRGETIEGIEFNAFNPLGYSTKCVLSDEDLVVAIYKNDPSIPHVWGTYLAENKSLV